MRVGFESVQADQKEQHDSWDPANFDSWESEVREVLDLESVESLARCRGSVESSAFDLCAFVSASAESVAYVHFPARQG